MVTESSTDRMAIIRSLYAETGAGDWAAAEQRLTEDFIVSEADHLPMAGTWHGRGALRTLYELVFSILDIAGLEIEDITLGHDHAVAMLDMVLSGQPGQRVKLLELFRFRGSQICEIRPYYFDPAPLIAQARPRRSSV